MKYLQLYAFLFTIAYSSVEIKSLPIENQQQVAVLLPDTIRADLPTFNNAAEKSVVATVPETLLKLKDADKTSVDGTEGHQRRTRGLGLGGVGGLGGLGNHLGSLGSSFKGFGGFGNWGFGGLHGLGLGGYKPLFGKYFG